MFDRLYVVTGGLSVEELARATLRRGTVVVEVQKYVAVHGRPFIQAWEETAQCTLKVGGLDNDSVQTDACSILNLLVKVVNVETTRPAPRAQDFTGAEELSGLALNLLYDFEQGVGVILNGHNGTSRRPAITEPRFNVMIKNGEDELVSREILNLMGIPQALQASEELLRELGLKA